MKGILGIIGAILLGALAIFGGGSVVLHDPSVVSATKAPLSLSNCTFREDIRVGHAIRECQSG
jgi:hypothetical protein